MARIRSLRPNVSREEAMQQFTSGLLDFLRETAFGPLRSVADFYIPFRLFRIEILNRGKRDLRVFGLDAVNGSLDLYHFEQLPDEREVTYLETRNCSEALLGEAEAQAADFRGGRGRRNLCALLGGISWARDARSSGRGRRGTAQGGRSQGAAIVAGLVDLDPRGLERTDSWRSG